MFELRESYATKKRLTKRALDAGESAAFSSIFLALSLYCSQAESTPAPAPVTPAVGCIIYWRKTNRVPNLKTAKVLWSITEVLTLIVSIGGLLIKGLYENLFQADYLPGAVAQDLITLLLSIALLVLIYFTKQENIKKQIVILGVIGSQWYLYGIFTIERVYNLFYLFYLAIFALAFWSLLYSLSGFRSERFRNLRISNGILKTTAVSSIVIAILFNILWVMSLLPLMREHDRIEYLYSIYILDLGFIMPAFFVTAIMSLRRMPLGILMTPAMMIVGFFVIFPLGLNELAKPAFRMTINYGSMLISFIFSIYMLALAYFQLRSIRLEP